MAQAVHVQRGKTVDFVADADYSGGTIIVQGELVGVLQRDVATGELGALAVVGVFDFPAAAEDFTAGAVAYYDGGPGNATETATDNVRAGLVVEDAASGSETVRILLNA